MDEDFRDHHFGVAVSGGVDSMVLYALMRQSKLKFTVLHCNFNLRGEESIGDAALVRTKAAQNGHTFLIKDFGPDDFKGKGSTQMVARELRYTWFDQLVRSGDIDFVLTAHHGDDQVETILLNLIRGTGIQGLRGIPPRHNRVLRPLLGFRKQEIRDYAKSNGVSFREDSSNASNDYLRNRIRNEVLPLLRDVTEGLDNRLLKNADIWQNESDALNEYLHLVRTQYLTTDSNGSEVLAPMEESESTTRLLLRDWLIPNGFTQEDVVSVAHWMAQDPPVGSVLESDTHELFVERKGFRLVRTNASPPEVSIDQPGVWDNGRSVLKIEHVSQPVDFGQSFELINADKLQFPLIWRNWKPGDRFQPLGMKGSKLVSDFLTDLKVAPSVRKSQTVVTDRSGSIVVLPGLRIADAFKITEQTEAIFKVTWTKK